MGYEVEVKYRVADHEALARQLVDLGAAVDGEIEQEDLYLAHPSRDFMLSGEAFRVRRDGALNRLTYKGPKRAGPTKTREEVELAFQEGPEGWQAMLRVLEALGFRPVATVRKLRRPFHLVRNGRAIEVVLDRVQGLGTFAEVETLAEDDDLAGAQAAVLAAARELGLELVEPRSYLRILLESQRQPGAKPSGQT